MLSVMVSVIGEFMKLWFYKCQRRFPPENDGCFPPVPPILLLYTHNITWRLSPSSVSVCWHLGRPSCLDCKEMVACIFVWYSNQTAAGSGPSVCYHNTRMDVWGNDGKAVGFALFAYILLFLWLHSDYHFARPDIRSNFSYNNRINVTRGQSLQLTYHTFAFCCFLQAQGTPIKHSPQTGIIMLAVVR